MILYLLRHAPTLANTASLVLGSSDIPAAPGFEPEFERLAGLLADKGLERIFSSPLARAALPAACLAARLHIPVEILPELRELSAGSLEGCPRPSGNLRHTWFERPPAGESLAQAENRAARALSRATEACPDATAAIVGHSVLNRVLLKLLGAASEGELLSFTHPFGFVLQIGPGRSLGYFRPDASFGSGLPERP